MNNKILQESADDSILQEDLDRISESDIPLEELKGKTVLVTGATGLIGSLLVKALQCCNRRKETGIKILALVRNQEKAEKLFGDLLKREDLKLVIGDITMPVAVEDKIDYIIHCASITTSKIMISRPVDVIRTSLNGTENLLELAKEKQVRSMVYVSSMEMYGVLNLQDDQMVTEEMTGYLNPLALRSNYPESKRMCENMCVAYGTQYEVPVKIARLAQTFGAGVLPGENRVFAQFARSAMKGSDIVLHTEGKSEGNYCYTADAVRALLTILVIILQNNYTTKHHIHKQYFDACVPEAGIDRYNKNGRAALRKEAARSAFCRWPCSDGIYLGISYLKAALQSARSPAVLS